ncbi:hypothetical protein SpCBS45565_g01219 [Spizellomyces sp. 'palustris']|nr:hypothetical protein SpCBS45565_g01219 [Spizellomyces sp. 'palustris']
MRAALTFLLTVLWGTASITALPRGAPKCAINPTVIANGHEVKNTQLNFGAQPSANTYTPGQQMTLTITGQRSWKGLLMYATPGTQQDAALAPNNLKQHVGVFAIPKGFRPQTTSICQAAGITQDAPESTVTHADTSTKGTNLQFQWTAPNANVGPITFNLVIATDGEEAPWEILQAVTIQPQGGATAPPPNGNGTLPATPPLPPPAPAPAPIPPAPARKGDDDDDDDDDGDDDDEEDEDDD